MSFSSKALQIQNIWKTVEFRGEKKRTLHDREKVEAPRAIIVVGVLARTPIGLKWVRVHVYMVRGGDASRETWNEEKERSREAGLPCRWLLMDGTSRARTPETADRWETINHPFPWLLITYTYHMCYKSLFPAYNSNVYLF